MSQYQNDDFSKAYTTALYQTKGEVQTNVRVKSDESLEIDLLFIGNLQSKAWATEDLGVFDQMMRVHPTIVVEHYSGYLSADHVARCGTRMDHRLGRLWTQVWVPGSTDLSQDLEWVLW